MQLEEVPCSYLELDTPSFAEPVLEGDALRFVAKRPWCSPGSPDVILRAAGSQAEIRSCDQVVHARPGDTLGSRYATARDRWTEAEITRLGLERGPEPASLVHEQQLLGCSLAYLDVEGTRPRLWCFPPQGSPDLWFDARSTRGGGPPGL